MQSIDFSRWLTRLGLKSDEQPPIIRTVQPVAIVADHRSLVSDPIWSAYMIGSEITPTIGQFASVLCVTPVPLKILELSIAINTAGSRIVFNVGNGTPPPIAAASVLTPQLFRPEKAAEALWRHGDSAVAAVVTDPTIRASTTNLVILHEIRVPASGWFHIHAASITQLMTWTAVIHELPNEFGD